MDLSKQDREVNNNAGTVARERDSWSLMPPQGLGALVGIVSPFRGSRDS